MKVNYWDAGYVQLDVSDPANPVLINDTTFAGEDPLLPGTDLTPEGNAHQGEFSFDNQFMLTADEDFGAYRPGTSLDRRAEADPPVGFGAAGVGGGRAAPDRRAARSTWTSRLRRRRLRFVGDGCTRQRSRRTDRGTRSQATERDPRACSEVRPAIAEARTTTGTVIFANNSTTPAPRRQAANAARPCCNACCSPTATER